MDKPFNDVVRELKKEEAELLLLKHSAYGPKNIANAPGGPLNGLAVRLHDKLARLAHLIEKGHDPEWESLEDTFLDIAGYGSIGTLVLRNEWPADSDED